MVIYGYESRTIKKAPKSWCFWTVVSEKLLESPLDCKEIQTDHSEGDQPWDFFGGNDAEAETQVLWPPHAKCEELTHWKRLWCWKRIWWDWGQEEEGTTEDEMAGWHHWLNGSESKWTPWTGKPGMLRFMGSQRVGHDWATELNLVCYRKISKTQLTNSVNPNHWVTLWVESAKEKRFLLTCNFGSGLGSLDPGPVWSGCMSSP